MDSNIVLGHELIMDFQQNLDWQFSGVRTVSVFVGTVPNTKGC